MKTLIRRCPLQVALAGVLLLACPSGAQAQKTPLYQVDLEQGTNKDFTSSKGRGGSDADNALDALLDEATEKTFSGKDLEKLAQTIQRYLTQARPRAMPRMLLFLYPGRISKSRLKELREVTVDIELLVDPCGRTICSGAIAQQLEVLGKAMRTTRLGGDSYRVTFKQVRLRRRLDLPGADFEELRFPAEAVVAAGRSPGGGRRLIKELDQAKAGYEQQVARSMQKILKRARIRLKGMPRVERSGSLVRVAMELRSDRVRCRNHVLKAFAAAGKALKANPLTPTAANLTVTALIPMRGTRRRVFTCNYRPLTLHLAGRLTRSEFWSTYVVETSKKGRHMSFDDPDTGSGSSASGDDHPDRTNELLGAHINLLAPCLQAEARISRSFSGVTLRFRLSPAGRVERVSLKERGASPRLHKCLKRALSRIRFPRRPGAPRQVEYPLHIQR